MYAKPKNLKKDWFIFIWSIECTEWRREKVFCSLVHSPNVHNSNAELISGWEPGDSSGSLTWVRGPKDWNYPPVLSQPINWELHLNEKIWDTKVSKHMGCQTPQVRELTCYTTTVGTHELLILFSVVFLEKLNNHLTLSLFHGRIHKSRKPLYQVAQQGEYVTQVKQNCSNPLRRVSTPILCPTRTMKLLNLTQKTHHSFIKNMRLKLIVLTPYWCLMNTAIIYLPDEIWCSTLVF